MSFVHRIVCAQECAYIVCARDCAAYGLRTTGGCYIRFVHKSVLHIISAQEGAVLHARVLHTICAWKCGLNCLWTGGCYM